jgi:hypothetical protein
MLQNVKHRRRIKMKTRNKIVIVLSAILGICLVTLACTGIGPMVVGSSQSETREFDIKDFTNVEVGSTFKVEISRSDSYQVSITANKNLFDYLVVAGDNGTLKINLEPLHTYTSITTEAQITLPDLHSLHLSGASRGEVSGFKSAQELDLEVSGASALNANDMETGNTRFMVSGASHITGKIKVVSAKFNISGASTIELTGSANEMDVLGSGASSVRLVNFPTGKAKFNLSGASNGTADISDKLDIVLSGASRLVYTGNASLGSKSISGASTLNHQQ